jgi:OPA family glycerol-3-phosphate transporter-like MFS transporter
MNKEAAESTAAGMQTGSFSIAVKALERIAATKESAATAERKPLPSYVYFPLAMIMLGIIAQGVLRDGVTNWMPAYLLESFNLSEENSIFSTVILAIFSVFSFSLFNLLHRKPFRNEVTCSAVIFLGATVFAFFIDLVSLTVTNATAATVLYLRFISLLTGCMHGANLMLVCMVPAYFKSTGKVGTVSGILNAATYVGSAAFTYGVAVLSDALGWDATILIWLGIAAVGTAICLICSRFWNSYQKKFS